MPTTHLANEWSLLQNQCDSYEKHGLLIKLVAIVLLGTTLLVRPGNEPAIAAVICVLWLQDAIWKTFQHRIETRLLQPLNNRFHFVVEKRFAGDPVKLHT